MWEMQQVCPMYMGYFALNREKVDLGENYSCRALPYLTSEVACLYRSPQG